MRNLHAEVDVDEVSPPGKQKKAGLKKRVTIRLPCSVCSETFSCRSTFRRHIKHVHGDMDVEAICEGVCAPRKTTSIKCPSESSTFYSATYFYSVISFFSPT